MLFRAMEPRVQCIVHGAYIAEEAFAVANINFTKFVMKRNYKVDLFLYNDKDNSLELWHSKYFETEAVAFVFARSKYRFYDTVNISKVR